ncbi:unknown; predicted coding region [Mycoplasmopsis pulmonis]|uniref:Uncharacterized protein n=1 Tax=Mycoplasmopsis pulmonis (strain UAB CTIP) TaxID=272635 RepID=Q98QP4_MYCPU|nr:unknown; predicted coding region [Mycoplasmopsis pulmonis]
MWKFNLFILKKCLFTYFLKIKVHNLNIKQTYCQFKIDNRRGKNEKQKQNIY